MDPIKQAFLKVKQDILELKQEIKLLKEKIEQLSQLTQHSTTTKISTIPTQIPTQPPIPTDNQTQIPAKHPDFAPKLSQNTQFSTGNKGVPTDRQTDKQTDRQKENTQQKDEITDFERVKRILDSLDSIKKEIRLKFKRLTPQEMKVFSTLYSFEDQGIEEITYKLLADHLKLSESSIRDYVNKLINKGIPILKTRLNNKKIILKIEEDLKNIASLSTIIRLREL